MSLMYMANKEGNRHSPCIRPIQRLKVPVLTPSVLTLRRRGERVAARTQLEVDRQIVQNMYRRRNKQLFEAKPTYFTNKVKESKDDPKALFRLNRNMMGNSGENILPVHTCKKN